MIDETYVHEWQLVAPSKASNRADDKNDQHLFVVRFFFNHFFVVVPAMSASETPQVDSTLLTASVQTKHIRVSTTLHVICTLIFFHNVCHAWAGIVTMD